MFQVFEPRIFQKCVCEKHACGIKIFSVDAFFVFLSPFGKAFKQAAQRVEARVRNITFETYLIEIQKDDWVDGFPHYKYFENMECF